MSESIAVLPGDGIGPEITEAAVSVLDAIGDFEFHEGRIGGSAMDVCDGDPLPQETIKLAQESRVTLLGAVGGPKWESNDPDTPRPEDGLLGIRRALNLHANLRPVRPFVGLHKESIFKPPHLANVDFVVVRELSGGAYFGEKGRNPERTAAFDTIEYTDEQIADIGHTAFELAKVRAEETGKKPHVTSIDKANVLETSRLWRETITQLHTDEYSEAELEHLLVDNAAFQILADPRQRDVLLTENMFGDILSDEAALLLGSLGLAPSASLNNQGQGLYEPIHGSAPDLAGKGVANPTAMLLSAAMALRYGLDMPEEAKAIESAVEKTIADNIRTADLSSNPKRDKPVSTVGFTRAVLENLPA